ncbi:MAG: carboxypeptidase-like regulatory domain-containing protein [Acidobacteriota bacterium]|nr:carboxypeptidase-like regulatory domain-containing protein [Acidobacteriota bacterium]
MLVACLLPASVLGQTAATARISGLVTDANGAIVPGATVKMVDQTTKSEKTSTTNDEGRYVFANIDPATYDITVTAQGFRTLVISGVKADIAVAAVQDVTLEAGSVSETVTISATGEVQLQTDDAAIGNVFNEERLKRLPNINRQATTLLQLQPVVAPSGEASGTRADQNAFSLDGLDVSDNVGFRGAFGTVVPVPTESVEEFRSTVANPNATFSGAAGAQVTLVTKRGGNVFHGSAYIYHQNDNLNANSWNNNRLGLRRPELKDNRFGGSIGGPIWRDHTFFFSHYEGRRLPGSTQVTRLVPTQSLRSGILRFRDASGTVFTVDPRTLDPRGLGSNPRILEYLAQLPMPNDFSVGDGLNTAGFIINLPTTLEDDFGVLRLDHQFSDNWSLLAKGSLFRSLQTSASQANLIDLQSGAVTAQRPKNLVFNLTGTLRSNLVNEIVVGHAYDSFVLGVIDPTPRAGFNLPVNIAGGTLDELVDVDTQRARQQTINSGTTQIADNATWTKGAHTFQFGGNLRRISTFHFRNDKVLGSLSNVVAEIGTTGGFVTIPAAERPPTCSATVTTNCITAANVGLYNNLYASLLGTVSSVAYLATRDGSLQPFPAGTGLVNDAKFRDWQFYFADTWRMKPSLVLSYGLTYGWHTPPIDKEGRQSVLVYRDTLEPIDPVDYLRQKREAAENGDIFNPDIAYVPINETGREGVFDINRKNFSPRVSLAWQPSFSDGLFGRFFGDKRTVIRGGYGLIYDRLTTIGSVIIPMLGVGFAQTLSTNSPRNSAGHPFRVGVDGPIPQPPANFAVTSPVVPAQGFGEFISLTLDPKIGDPYNHALDFTVQRELPGNMLLEVGYVGRLGRNLYQNVNLNSLPYFFKDRASGQRFAEAFDAVALQLRSGVAPGAVTPQPWFENQLPGLPGGGTRFFAGRNAGDFINGNLNNIWAFSLDFVAPRPYNNTQVADLFIKTSLGRSNYHALFFTLRQRLTRGLTFDVNYTLSKSLDQIGQIQNAVSEFSTSYFPDADYGPSDFDRRHILNANAVYDLPFGRGHRFQTGNWADNLIGGWYVAGIFQAASGVPLLVGQGTQGFGGSALFGTTTGALPLNNFNFGNNVNRGVVGSGGIGVNGNPARRGSGLNIFANPEQVFNNFRRVQISQDGRQGRGVLRGFSNWNLDFSLGKETKIGERLNFVVTADFFNVFNRVNFLNPSLSLGAPANFGVVTGAFTTGNLAQRRVQVGGRFEF